MEEACGDPSAGARRLNFPAVLEVLKKKHNDPFGQTMAVWYALLPLTQLSPDSSSPLPPFKQERSQQADSVRQPDRYTDGERHSHVSLSTCSLCGY